EESHVGMGLGDVVDHRQSPTSRHVHVDEDYVGIGLADAGDGVVDVGSGAHDLEPIGELFELGLHSGEEQGVIVDQKQADHLISPSLPLTGTHRWTSVPSPGLASISEPPPTLCIRPRIESFNPRRSSGTDSRSKPRPKSATKTSIRSSVTSA